MALSGSATWKDNINSQVDGLKQIDMLDREQLKGPHT